MPLPFLKSILPRTLFWRAVLIVVLPMVLVQAVSSYVFYERHWDNVRKHMAMALANEVQFVVRQAIANEDLSPLSGQFGLHIAWHSTMPPSQNKAETQLTTMDFFHFRQELDVRLRHPFQLAHDDAKELVRVFVSLPQGVLEIATTRKRVASATSYIFLLWMNGAALFFLLVAILFLRNQVRPIQQLAGAAEGFGKGQERVEFKPRGAAEVRRAGHAFIRMRERIARQLTERAEMLAAISHDLRTPITRLKLQLAMLAADKHTASIAADMTHDLTDMEHMVQEYLEFIRGEGGEQPKPILLESLLGGVADAYIRQGEQVTLTAGEPLTLSLREQGMRRCLNNIISNALRYGSHVHIRWKLRDDHCLILIDDNGTGIPEAERADVFRPFVKREEARTAGQGGVGLGLAIARDMVLAHGGDISLEDAPSGGLRVVIALPV